MVCRKCAKALTATSFLPTPGRVFAERCYLRDAIVVFIHIWMSGSQMKVKLKCWSLTDWPCRDGADWNSVFKEFVLNSRDKRRDGNFDWESYRVPPGTWFPTPETNSVCNFQYNPETQISLKHWSSYSYGTRKYEAGFRKYYSNIELKPSWTRSYSTRQHWPKSFIHVHTQLKMLSPFTHITHRLFF